jgi:hypothetical protein
MKYLDSSGSSNGIPQMMILTPSLELQVGHFFFMRSAKRNDVGGLLIGAILEVLEHLGLIGVFDLEPLTLCVISGGGTQINLKNAGGVNAISAVLGDVDAAAGAEGYEDLVLVCGVVV